MHGAQVRAGAGRLGGVTQKWLRSRAITVRPPGPSQPRWRQAARRRRRGGERSRDHMEGKVAASRPRTDGAGLQMEPPVFKLTD